MVVRGDFAEAHPDIVCRFVKTAIEAVADYNAHPTEYGPGTDKGAAVAAAISGDPDQAGAIMGLHDFPPVETQLSPAWLGGGAAAALGATSEFLKAQGKIDAVLDSYDGAIDAGFVQRVKDGGC